MSVFGTSRRLGIVVLLIAASLPGCLRKAKTTPFFDSSRPTATAKREVKSGSSASAKGTMTLKVEGTDLDFLLDVLVIKGNSFQLTGQGVKLAGTLGNPPGRELAKLVGQTFAIQTMNNVFGNSELDLPGTGVAPVTGGQVLIEAVSGQRVRGRISFRVQGPFGEQTFAGTYDVGAVVQE